MVWELHLAAHPQTGAVICYRWCTYGNGVYGICTNAHVLILDGDELKNTLSLVNLQLQISSKKAKHIELDPAQHHPPDPDSKKNEKVYFTVKVQTRFFHFFFFAF